MHSTARSISVAMALSWLLLSACHDDALPTAAQVAPPATATLSISPASVELVAGSGTPATLTVTNTSSNITATAVKASLPAGWSDVIEDASGCASLAPQAHCALNFKPGSGSHPATVISIGGQNAATASATLAVSMPNSAAIIATGTPLSLLAGSGAAASITVTNTSAVLTAVNIAADLSGTPLRGALTQDASDCASVPPGASCLLRFTPMNSAVTLSTFSIHGDNTGQASGAIQITLPSSANITLTGSPLTLQASFGTPMSGTLTVTNTSVLTATHISAQLAGTALAGALTQDASNCISLAPGASCTLTFTPGSGGVPASAVIIQGSNTSQAGASIAINAAPTAALSLTGSPLILIAGGTAGVLTVINTSTLLTATNVTANTTGTALAGNVTIDSSTCLSIAPMQSCSISFTPGSNGVAQTAITIAGGNTQTVTADITINALAIGDSYEGGIVFQLPAGGQPGAVVSATDVVTGISWYNGTSVATNALSLSDGVTNTATIVAAQGVGNYAAIECANYTAVDGNGTSYANWYLPAKNELNTVYQALAGLGNGNYWSSTEMSTTNAWAQSFSSGAQIVDMKQVAFDVRCIRAF